MKGLVLLARAPFPFLSLSLSPTLCTQSVLGVVRREEEERKGQEILNPFSTD